MTRDVVVKDSFLESGVGSVDAGMLWESDPTEEGAFVRFDSTADGRLFVSLTDMEEFDGAYVSVEITTQDVERLFDFLRSRQGRGLVGTR